MKELLKFGGEISSKKALITGIIGGIILLFLWWLATANGSVSPKILPNPIDVLASIPTMFANDNLLGNILYTVKLNVVGYIYAILISIPLGFLIGIYPLPRAMFQKPLEALRFLPMPSISPILIACLGISFGMKSTFLALGIIIYIMPAVVQRVSDLQNPNNVYDNVFIQTGKTLGMTKWQMFRQVYFPYVMERVYTDIRSLCAISLTYIVICECLNKEGGIGAMISTLSRQSRMPEVYALLFIIVLIGIIQDWLFKKFDPIIFKHHRA